ncbi:unnamed protein product [Spirodela intermedia]|uniref:Uncharacterized protein n=1 Tax=Spirodela intermedia TaxID=51605 RepID=A0ABN7E8R4_SPIIN|nr:unnamed protein product [Spirodela intermedia]
MTSVLGERESSGNRRLMKWVVESSPTAVTRQSGKKRRLCGSPAAVTRWRGARWRRWRLVSRRSSSSQ